MEKGKRYLMTSETSTATVVVLHVGKSLVKVQDVEGKWAGTEPYYVNKMDSWTWTEIN